MFPAAAIVESARTRNFICSPGVGKIVLVLIGGEHKTRIVDETPTNAAISDYQNRHHLAVTWFGDTMYLLRIQFDCPRKFGSDSFETDCKLAHHADVWIDLNNDGKFDESENRVYRRPSIYMETEENTYDLEILIPLIDGTITKAGPHRMRVRLMRSEAYQKQCGDTDDSEIREYTVNIVRKKRCEGKNYPLIDYSNLSRS